MAVFTSYNTDDPNATAAGYTVLGANGTYTSDIIQTQYGQHIVGSVFADQAGTLVVAQSFDGGLHWDVQSSFTVTANQGQGFEVDVIAPIAQLQYTNGATPQTTHFRLFARVFSTGR